MLNPSEHVLDYVDDYLHEALSADNAEAVEQHCEGCSICGAAMAEARKRLDAVTSVPSTEISGLLVKQTMEHIERVGAKHERNWQRLWRTVALATAASVLAIGGWHVSVHNIRPTPYDLRILGQDRWLAGSTAAVRVVLFDRERNEVMDDVPVELVLGKRDGSDSVQLVSFNTRRDVRSPAFELPDWDGGRYELRVTARPAGTTETIVKSVQLRRSWKLMVSTDKPVYQPGQTIHIRALALRQPDLKPVTGQEVTFSITDPKGNVIFKEQDVSSGFGISTADCPLATEIIEGQYEIQCRVGETQSTRSVKVEKYVLPKFRVAVHLDKPFYQPNERVSVVVQSDYFFGNPVAGAEVELQVFTTDVEPTRIVHQQLHTNDQGTANLQFRLPEQLIGRPQTSGDSEIQVFATVTDSAGQTYSAVSKQLVTANPIRLEVIPESATLVRDVANTVYLFASYADGRPAHARLIVGGIPTELETNLLGVASFEITPNDEAISVTVKATDVADGNLVGRRTVRLACGRPHLDYLLRPDKAVYDGGDTMMLTALGGGVEPVFVDLIKAGQSVLTETIEMTRGRGELAIDVPADLFGTLRLVTHRIGATGLAVRKSRMLVVRQANQLNITTELDREEYRPGDKVQLRIQLSDEQGFATPGAVSLAAVDEAVFSVLNQASGMEAMFFLLEEELLEPIYAIYNWGLDGPHAEPQPPPGQWARFERALFSRSAGVVIGRRAVPSAFSGTSARRTERFGITTDVNPFTLSGNSFSVKQRNVARAQRRQLRSVTFAWWSLAGVLALTLAGTLAVYRPKAFLLASAVSALPVILLCMGGPPRGETTSTAEDLDEAGMAEGGDYDGMASGGDAGPAPPRVREYFPETLLWRPEIVTDDNGQAMLEIDLADSITTWRLSASAVSSGGRLGSAERGIRVFQPFFVDLNLPVALTRGDEVSVPIVVYNYLDQPQTVKLTVSEDDWFKRVDSVSQTESDATKAANEVRPSQPAPASSQRAYSIELAAGEVRSLNYPIRVLNVGRHELQVTASSGEVADAIRRSIEVLPNGRPVEKVVSGNLAEVAEVTVTIPQNAVPGSVQAIVKLHPSTFSQLIEGLDSIFRKPFGCFEQTSSVTYPNVLALDYLRRNDIGNPGIEAKARQYIHLGYQRLLTFEVAGGGFDWYGRPPAKESLTAYGLMELEDMARVHNVDPLLIDRTRDWLLSRRNSDGSWPMPVRQFGAAVRVGSNPDLTLTAYIARAVFARGKAGAQVGATLDYLLRHKPNSIQDPYVLSLVIMAVSGIDKNHSALDEYVARLESLKQSDPRRDLVWWDKSQSTQTVFYGAGESGHVETTAAAALALLERGQYRASARGALNWLVTKKDSHGTWRSTQATILALKALLAGTGTMLGEEKERRIELAVNGNPLPTIQIPVDQADVMKQLDLSNHFLPGEHRLSLSEPTETATNYQVAFRYHVEGEDVREPAKVEPLSVDIAYDRQRLTVDQTVTTVATLTNRTNQPAPMIILDLPVPGGFTTERGQWDELVASRKIAKYDITPRNVIVYLLGLQPGEKLELSYRLRANMPVKVVVPPGHAYEYYDPDKRGTSKPVLLEVTEA